MGEIDWAAFERKLHGGERPLTIEVVEPRVASILREKSGADRLAMVTEMFALVSCLALSGERAADPTASAQEHGRRVAARVLHGSR